MFKKREMFMLNWPTRTQMERKKKERAIQVRESSPEKWCVQSTKTVSCADALRVRPKVHLVGLRCLRGRQWG